PRLKGKPVVTGAERGLVIALSYEAKAYGIKRGMLGAEAKKLCPQVIFVSSDYETYGLFSKRMFDVIRRFTPQVEEYSIDEAFADITGVRRLHHASYPQITKNIKETIEQELGITVSAGLSLTKSLAKLASKFNKPSGLVFVSGREVQRFLSHNTVDKVWGFGHNSVALLNKHGIKTTDHFVNRPQTFAQSLFGKIGNELWQELSGTSVYPVQVGEKTTYATISKFKTFTPAINDSDYLYAQLLRNLERATAKMRRFHLATKRVVMVLRSSQFRDSSLEFSLSRPSASVLDMIPFLRSGFEVTRRAGQNYRATGVILCDLKQDHPVQLGLFEEPLRIVKTEKVDQAIDQINQQFGRHTIHLASTLPVYGHHRDDRVVNGTEGVVRCGPIRGKGLAVPLLQVGHDK
ncbi:MAG: hypothetical protein ACD_62C00596G0006, partial [uncultured bacterium]